MIDFIKRYWAIILITVYVISPIDFLPGPIDDLILIVLGVVKEMQQKELVKDVEKKFDPNIDEKSEEGKKENVVEGEIIEAKKVEKGKSNEE